MKKNHNFQPLLADMHFNGVRFDPRILEALRAQQATSDNAIADRTQNA